MKGDTAVTVTTTSTTTPPVVFSSNATLTSENPRLSSSSRSKIKHDVSVSFNTEAPDVEAIPYRSFVLVDEDDLLKWAGIVARCVSGNRMTVKECHAKGMAEVFVASCGQYDITEEMCASCGGYKCCYGVHNKLVKVTLQSSSCYSGVLELCASFNMQPIIEKTYFEIAKEIEATTIDQ